MSSDLQPPPKDVFDALPATPPPAYRGQNSSTPTPEPTGAAQFLTNLNDKQKAHLQFAIPANNEPDRLSQYLEGPRRTPVPKRFTFAAIDSEARKQQEIDNRPKSTKSSFYSHHIRDGSGSSASETGSDESRKATWSRAASSVGSLKRASTNLTKEMGNLKGSAVNLKTTVANAADWSFYATGASLCVVNLIIAWDATAVSIALPVCSSLISYDEVLKITDDRIYPPRLSHGDVLARYRLLCSSYCVPAALLNLLRDLRAQSYAPNRGWFLRGWLVHLRCVWKVHRSASWTYCTGYRCWWSVRTLRPHHFRSHLPIGQAQMVRHHRSHVSHFNQDNNVI